MQLKSILFLFQPLDKVHSRSYPGIFHFRNDRTSPLRHHRPRHRLFSRVSRTCLPSVDKRCILSLFARLSRILLAQRLCLEVVSPLFTVQVEYAIRDANNLITFISYRRTYHPRSYHIVQEIQKFNLSDYRPRQEQ